MLSSLSLSLPRVPSASQVARAAIRDGFAGTLTRQTLADLELVVSELVTNAIEHGRGAIDLKLELHAGELRGWVTDEGGGFRYEAREIDSYQPHGRGLAIVDALVTRWGIDEGSTHVWFEMTPAQGPSGPAADPVHDPSRGPEGDDATRRADGGAGRADPPLYNIELVRDGSVLRIRLQGEFDLEARPALEDLLLGLDPARLERVVVDIRQVTFFDTTGLNIAQRLDSWGRDHAIPVLFTRAVPAVANALRVSGLASTLTFSDAPEDQFSSSD